MEAQFEALSELVKNGQKLNFGQDFFVKFYQAFLYSDRWQQYIKGVGTTLLVTAIALVLGVVLGAIVAMVRVGYAQQKPHHRNPILGIFNAVAQVYVTVIRGTPMMVQLLIMSMVIFASSRNFTMVGALALGINSGAYVSEIIRGGLMAVDPGQMEAGRSLGLNYMTTMFEIIIPQAIRSILPALGNEFIMLLKDSSLITVIGGKELLYAAQGIMNRTYEPMFPLLGVAALGISRSNGLFDLSSKVNRPYAMFFTCALYLTIGPFFAIPRCATTSFTVGLEQVLPQNGSNTLYLLLFSVAFFAAALFFALRPGKILTWVGKILNPCFLVFLAILVVVALLSPSAAIADVEPLGDYASQPFFAGFLEGYNTMDALASLAFGIIVVQVIRDLGVDDPTAVAGSTVRAGIFSSLLMAFIYIAVTIAGTQSRGVLEASENGGTALAQIAQHYLGSAGLFILAATVTLACLKTAVGLITSCTETFSALFPDGPKYRIWAIIFSLVSLLFANLGLSAIISYSLPVLMFLYPLSIALIALALLGKFFGHDRTVYCWTIGFTLIAAVYDLIIALPESVFNAIHGPAIKAFGQQYLPFADLGLGWICPTLIGAAIGLILHFMRGNRAKA